MKLDYIGKSTKTPRSNIKGSVAVEGTMNNPDETEPNQFASRDTEDEESSGSSSRRDEPFAGKMNLNQASPANSGPDNGNMSIQLSLSEGFHDSSANSVDNVFPKSVEYWNGAGAAKVVGLEGARVVCLSGSLGPTINYHGPSSGRSRDYWIQDEKELKRQKRKEANRESARRSRMRKQAECDELAEKVQVLNAENEMLRTEVSRLSDLCQKLSSDNALLLERMGK